MAKKFMCTDGMLRTQKQIDEWLDNLRELAYLEPGDLTDEEWAALDNEGLL